MIKNLFILVLFILTLGLVFIILKRPSPQTIHPSINIVDNKNISWGKGWDHYRSMYGGSEFRFTILDSQEISFRVGSPNQDNDQGIQIKIDDKIYLLQTPDIDDKLLTISVPKGIHSVRVMHFCAGSLSPCEITIKSISINSGGKVLSKPSLPVKSLAILGDSIAVGWGIHNFSYLLLKNLDYQFRDAGIFGSTVSIVPGVDSSLLRYKKDIVYYRPDIVFVFLGTNDLGHKISLNEFKKNYANLIKGIKDGLPNAKIVTIGLLRRRDIEESMVKKYSAVIKDVSILMGVEFVDSYEWLDEFDFADAIHPSINSQFKLADQFLRIIKEL